MQRQTTKLNKVCKFLNGGTPSRENSDYFNGDIPWITGADITSFLVTKVRSFITEKAVKESATNLVPAGTVLLVTRTSVGKVAVAGMPLCFSQDITAIRNDEKHLDRGFLIYFLQTKESYFKQSARGATIGGITREVVSEIEIPLPPLPEQKRIAAILDKADRLRRQHRYAQTLSGSFLQSVFIKMFGDYLRKDEENYLENVLSIPLSNGIFESNDEYGSGTPVIWVDDLYHTVLVNTDNLRRAKVDEPTVKKYEVKYGDLLFTRSSLVREGIGQINFIPQLKEKTMFECHIIRARVNQHLVNPYYLLGLYRSSWGRAMIIQKSNTATMTTISQQALNSLLCPLPPLPLQEQFAKIVQKFERVRRQQREATRQAEHLFQTLLHRAFRGEL